jgi:hypothetical protein
MKRRQLKFVWPSREYVRVLEPEITRILAVIAEVTGIPGIRSAWVSDRSHVDDFFIDPALTPEQYRESLNRIEESLGIRIGDDFEEGYLVEMARTMISLALSRSRRRLCPPV